VRITGARARPVKGTRCLGELCAALTGRRTGLVIRQNLRLNGCYCVVGEQIPPHLIQIQVP
jgi:hypothetical protein